MTLPSESLAVALTVIVGFQSNIAPSAGGVMLAAGVMLSELTTVIA